MSAPAIRQGTAPRKFSRAADLTPAERVAVVLSLLEPEKARAVVEHWPQPAVDRVVVAYEGMGTLPKPVVLEVIAAFVSEVADPRPSVRGGQRHAAALAAAMGLGEAPAEEDERAPIEERLDGLGAGTGKLSESLDYIDLRDPKWAYYKPKQS